jgi:hypothetical protein
MTKLKDDKEEIGNKAFERFKQFSEARGIPVGNSSKPATAELYKTKKLKIKKSKKKKSHGPKQKRKPNR